MTNSELFKGAIAEAKAVRQAAIANAKEALEETITPHLKELLATKLQEMDGDSYNDEMEEETAQEGAEVVAEEETVDEQFGETNEENEEDLDGDSGESEEEESEEGSEEEAGLEGEEELDLEDPESIKNFIKQIIAQELGAEQGMEGGEEIPGEEIPGEEIPGEEMPGDNMVTSDEEEIDLDEILRELEMEEGEGFTGGGAGFAQGESDNVIADLVKAAAAKAGKSVKEFLKSIELGSMNQAMRNENSSLKAELKEAVDTIKQVNSKLVETNVLNSKLLYLNKVLVSNQNLTESQKANIVAAFDEADTIKEVKLVYKTLSESISPKKAPIKEAKIGMASKATGQTLKRPQVISETNSVVSRMQKLAGIIKD